MAVETRAMAKHPEAPAAFSELSQLCYHHTELSFSPLRDIPGVIPARSRGAGVQQPGDGARAVGSFWREERERETLPWWFLLGAG